MTGKRVTSMDVARLAGVSRSVVSAVINGTQGIGVSRAKREAVLKAMRELNYHVDAGARAMKTGRSYCVAAFGDTSNALFLQLLEGLQQACLRQGYHVLLVGRGDGMTGWEELISLYFQRRVDGIISLDYLGFEDPDWAAQVREHKVPYVSVEGYAGAEDIYSVMADYYGSVRTAMEYLEQSGVRGAAYLQMEDRRWPENWAETARRDAYEHFCAERGWTPRVEKVDKLEPEHVQAILEYDLANGQPAVYLSNWMDGALEMYRAAARLDLKVGREVKVMSADNTYRVSDQLVPRLSVMAVPYKEMGERAVDLILEQIEGGGAEAVAVADAGTGAEAEAGAEAGAEARAEAESGAGAGETARPVRKHWLAAGLLPGSSV
ncbi:LacI family DNA-binding transcriptional regulator [Paenibacillus pinistramenti]|uniref:LacI family DNA-binding transcriptional regulator n=1 Tax=Paenibacillus pinistramenti TaxID=1768003 RepID=UPI001108CF47|nr:LacI family DNA-binding transcriptional regulator [Paenibacillus pinistramenti]